MPNEVLNSNQMTTTGAKAPPILDVPSGWMRKSKIRMAQDVPTIVDVEMLSDTIFRLELVSGNHGHRLFERAAPAVAPH